MLPQKILKIKYLRLAKNAFPKIFQYLGECIFSQSEILNFQNFLGEMFRYFYV